MQPRKAINREMLPWEVGFTDCHLKAVKKVEA